MTNGVKWILNVVDSCREKGEGGGNRTMGEAFGEVNEDSEWAHCGACMYHKLEGDVDTRSTLVGLVGGEIGEICRLGQVMGSMIRL